MSAGTRIGAVLSMITGLVIVPVLRVDGGDDGAANPMITELMASNKTTAQDEDGKFSDWIEITNPTASPIDLLGWHLTDNPASPMKWTFPAHVLGAGQRVLVWASDSATVTMELHATFALSKGGEYLALTDPSGIVVQEFSPGFPGLADDVSYGLGSDGITGVLQSPTPGAPNTATVVPVAAPVLSRAGGYIEAPITVAVVTATPGATMRYTTDGSTPTSTHGTAVTGGQIDIAGSTMLRVVASKAGQPNSQVATATYLALDEVLAQDETADGWPSSSVNGQVFDYGFDQAYVDAHRADVEDGLQSLATVSIVTDQANLTHPSTGIYVNAANSGSQWERPASLEMFDGDGGFQINAGLRIRGGYSRRAENPKHSFRLNFSAAYGGVLQYQVFGDGGISEFSSIDLRTEQNFGFQTDEFGGKRNTLLREVWSRDAQLDANEPGTRSRYVNLFLNGQYWGMYMFQDRVNGASAARQFSGSVADAADYDVLKHANDYGYEIEDGDDDEWTQLWALAADLQVDAAEFATISSAADLRSLATFMIINAYAGNRDATPSSFLSERRANNWTAVRGPNLPFQFYITDSEHSLGADDHDVGVDRTGPFPVGSSNEHWSAHYFNPGWLHAALLSNVDYQWIVRDVAENLLDGEGLLSPEESRARWDERKADAARIVFPEAARWGAPNATDVDWATEVAWVETEWFPHRTALAAGQVTSWYPGATDTPPTTSSSTTTSTTTTTSTSIATSTTIEASHERIAGAATGSHQAVRLFTDT